VSKNINDGDVLRLAANESIISAVLKWAHANGRRLTKADLERMGAGVDAMVAENERLTKERDDALALLGCYKLDKDDLKARVRQLESEWSGWPALQREWFADKYAAMQPWDAVRARIEYSEARVKRLEEAGDEARAHVERLQETVTYANGVHVNQSLIIEQLRARVKRLEQAGDELLAALQDDWSEYIEWINESTDAVGKWKRAKEAKP
jgi:chromosome segregation ATPase